MPRRTHKQRGGKFIGEGTYGCGFSPSLKCVGQPRKEGPYLSKMITDKHEAETEFAISQLISRVDPERKYFLTADSMCDHDQRNIRPNNKTEECKKFPLDGPTYLISYEMGGDNLSKLKIPANLYPEFFVGLIGLIEGLVLLHSNDMVHLDIKPDNIVGKFYDDRYKIRYIDFGLSREVATLHANSDHVKMIRDFNLETPYPYYPFDTIMSSLNRQRNPTISQEEIGHWYRTTESRKYNTILPQDSFWNANRLPKYTGIYLSTEYARTTNWYKNLSDHLKSVDMYALTVSLCEIYKRLTGHIRTYDPNGNPIIAIFAGTNFYWINDDLKKDFGEEIYNFHKSLAVLSMQFYEHLLPLLLPFGNLRPKASDVLKVLGPLLGSTEDIFKDSNLTYRAFSTLGIAVEKAIIVNYSSALTGVTNISAPHSLALSETNENLPPGWEKVISSKGYPFYYHRLTHKSQWAKPPMRPPGEPPKGVANPLHNMKKPQPVNNPLYPKKRTRKNRRSN
jgi:serine/threonine protein kinase